MLDFYRIERGRIFQGSEIIYRNFFLRLFLIAQLKQKTRCNSSNSKWHRSFKVDVSMRSPPRFRRKYKRRKEATKRFRVIKAIGPSRWLILLVATIRGIVFSWRKARHDNRNIQEAAIVAASGVFFAPPPPFHHLPLFSAEPSIIFYSKPPGFVVASRIVPRCSTSSPFKRLPLSLSFSRLVATILHVVSFEYLSKMRNMNFPPHLPRFSFIPLLFPSPLTHIRRDTELKRKFSALASIVACISSGIVAIGVCRK